MIGYFLRSSVTTISESASEGAPVMLLMMGGFAEELVTVLGCFQAGVKSIGATPLLRDTAGGTVDVD